jgi:selenocysteine lyase/cysteine desulfurase
MENAETYRLIDWRRHLSGMVNSMLSAAEDAKYQAVKQAQRTGVAGRARDYTAEIEEARAALAEFDAAHPEVLIKVEADRKADTSKWI